MKPLKDIVSKKVHFYELFYIINIRKRRDAPDGRNNFLESYLTTALV